MGVFFVFFFFFFANSIEENEVKIFNGNARKMALERFGKIKEFPPRRVFAKNDEVKRTN